MPILIKQEVNSPQIKLTHVQIIALDILLSNYDLTELDNLHAGATLMALAGDIDYFLVNNNQTYKQCETPLTFKVEDSAFTLYSNPLCTNQPAV